jgi:hypothetical protein
MTAQSTSFKNDGLTKKPYQSPQLVPYGDIREVTHAVGMTTTVADGAHGSTNKTA